MGAVSQPGGVYAGPPRRGHATGAGFMQEGAQLGHLWMEGHFEVGDPLTLPAARATVRSRRPGLPRGDSAHACGILGRGTVRGSRSEDFGPKMISAKDFWGKAFTPKAFHPKAQVAQRTWGPRNAPRLLPRRGCIQPAVTPRRCKPLRGTSLGCSRSPGCAARPWALRWNASA